jgi:hypothetical protein
VWIRSSTGHLSIDLTPPQTDPVSFSLMDDGALPSGTSLLTPPPESETITSISLKDYHEICYWHLCRVQYWSVSPNASVELGSLRYSSGPEYEGSLKVASYDCGIDDSGWATVDPIIEGHIHP